MRVAIRGDLRPAATTLTVVAGDFNWIADRGDRTLNGWPGSTPHPEEKEEEHWLQCLLAAGAGFERSQDQLTHKSGPSMARLDRVYANYAPADQLDRHLSCNVLDRTTLSDHRAVTFGRSTPDKKSNCLTAGLARDPAWLFHTNLRYRELVEGNAPNSAVAMLSLVKKAMAEAGEYLRKIRTHRPPDVATGD